MTTQAGHSRQGCGERAWMFSTTPEQWIAFHCPGCDDTHGIPVDGSRGWTWNGSLDRPTVSPSILVNKDRRGGRPLCHSFVREGRIEFLGDCTHALAGQTVDLPAPPEHAR